MENRVPLNPADVQLGVGEDGRFKVKVKTEGGVQVYPAEISESASVETLETREGGEQVVLLPEIF